MKLIALEVVAELELLPVVELVPLVLFGVAAAESLAPVVVLAPPLFPSAVPFLQQKHCSAALLCWLPEQQPPGLEST